jgi:LCP family protein required for cell wall assembly
VSTPVGDQPTGDDAGNRGTPGGPRRGHGSERDAGRGAGEPLTVEQLLARQDGSVGRRRAARRGGEQPSAPAAPPPGVRNGLPPVPGATTPPPGARSGLPPVPGGATRQGTPAPPRPSLPVRSPDPGTPADWQPEPRPSRRSGPIPPLPGTVPPPPPNRRTGRTAPPREPLSPGRRRLVRAAVALAAVVGVVLLYHLGLYFYVDQKIGRVDALATDGPEVIAAQLQEASDTYLVVGTGVPGQDGVASVATLLATVSDDGERAVLVAVPPTAMVDTPQCRDDDGALREPTTEAFADALLDGSPACMVRAVQQLSGLRVDHYLGVDLAGLPRMVDALGGVDVCIIPSTAASAAAAPPPAGASTLSGEAASGYLQPGDSGADVTGTAVAERAQRLLTSTLRSAMSTDVLLNPLTLTRFLSTASDALTVDEQTTLGNLRSLAGSLGNVSGEEVQRAALPVSQVGYVPAGSEQAYVLLDGAGTRALFDAVIDGARVPEEFLLQEEPVPAVAGEAQPTGGDVPAEQPAGEPTVAPQQVSLDVLNGTGTTGLAGTVADELRAQGFVVGAVGNEQGSVSGSVVRYGPGLEGPAATVAAAVPGAVLQPSDAIGATVQLVIGPGYTGVVPVTLVEEAPPAPETTAAAPEPEAAAVSCG